MSVLRSTQLKWKIVGVSVLLLALLALEAVLAEKAVVFVVFAAGLLLGGGLALVTVLQMHRGFERINERLAACAKGTQEHLLPALRALAAGDLTVDLHSATSAATDFPRDEQGEIMRHIEVFRGAVIDCYDAYNETAAKLRELVGTMSTTAGTVGAASQEMSSTSEEAGKATGEIAQAINDVAEGAERQARMAEDAQRSAQEIARAVAESAESAEQTAEVAHNAHERGQARRRRG